MKKILIVIENFNIGGIQKSLHNMLIAISGMYEIDVAAFDPVGEYKESMPSNIRYIRLPHHYQMFARSRRTLKHSFLIIYKMIFFILAKVLNKGRALSIVSPLFKIHKQYDVAISFSHSGYYKGVNGICPEFVLQKTKADKKVCFIHCDYEHSGLKCEYNNALYALFDRIVCCSDSVREVFLQSNPALELKSLVVRNFFDLALLQTVKEDLDLTSEKVNIFSVARLSEEKGIVRAIEALHNCKRNDINYYIIGEGPQKDTICQMISNYCLNEQVFLLGATSNPYPKLLNADYLLVPSYNEAAPMVFDEAKLLGIRIITTETTSAREMLGSDDIICDNSTDGIYQVLRSIKKPVAACISKEIVFNNDLQIKQFMNLVC